MQRFKDFFSLEKSGTKEYIFQSNNSSFRWKNKQTNKLGKLAFVLHCTSNLFPTSDVRFMFVYCGEKVIHQANTLHIQGDDLLGLPAG